MIHNLKELRRMPLTRLIELHDEKAESSTGNVNYYLNEIARRDQARATNAIIFLTVVLILLTGVLVWLTYLLWAKGG